jgi:NitT/TauT family transport system substrate-binding protein
MTLLLSACVSTPPPAPDPDPTPSPCALSLSLTYQAAALKGPTAMGLAQVIAAAGENQFDTCPVSSLEWTLAGTADEITPRLVNGSLTFAAVPVNLAAVLYAKTDGAVQLLAINTLGVLHVVTKGTEVTSLADLRGQTVWSTGKGTTPQYVLDYLLDAAGLTGQVQVEYLSEAAEAGARLVAADRGIAVLPEPYVTTVMAQDPAIRRALDLTEEWDKVADAPLVTGALVVTRDTRADVVAALLTRYRDSVDFVTGDPAAAGELIAGLGIVPSAAIAEQAIPGAHIVLLTGAEARAAAEGYLQVLFDANPESVGGALPGDGFYYGV